METLTMDAIHQHTRRLVKELDAGDFPVTAFPEAIQKIIYGISVH